MVFLKGYSIFFVVYFLLLVSVFVLPSSAAENNSINTSDIPNNREISKWKTINDSITNDNELRIWVAYNVKFFSRNIWYVVLHAEKVNKNSRKSYTIDFTIYADKRGSFSKSLTLSGIMSQESMQLFPQDITGKGNWDPAKLRWRASYSHN